MLICMCIFAQVYAFIFLVMLVYQLNVTGGEKKAANNSVSHVKWELEIGNPPKASSFTKFTGQASSFLTASSTQPFGSILWCQRPLQ